MKFKYNDKVKVTSGFWQGFEGHISFGYDTIGTEGFTVRLKVPVLGSDGTLFPNSSEDVTGHFNTNELEMVSK